MIKSSARTSLTPGILTVLKCVLMDLGKGIRCELLGFVVWQCRAWNLDCLACFAQFRSEPGCPLRLSPLFSLPSRLPEHSPPISAQLEKVRSEAEDKEEGRNPCLLGLRISQGRLAVCLERFCEKTLLVAQKDMEQSRIFTCNARSRNG